MKGKQIYFTQNEIQQLLCVLNEWQDLLGKEGEQKYAKRLEYGLGNVWRKLLEASEEKR